MVGKRGSKIYIISDNPDSPVVVKASPDGIITVADKEAALKTINTVKERTDAERRAKEANFGK